MCGFEVLTVVLLKTSVTGMWHCIVSIVPNADLPDQDLFSLWSLLKIPVF